MCVHHMGRAARHTDAMSHHPAARDEIVGALERTLLRGSARTSLQLESELPDDDASSPRPARAERDALGRAKAAAGHAVSQAILWGLRRAHEWTSSKMARPVVGVIDFAEHRCVQLPSGQSEAELIVGDERWLGAPGTAINRLTAKPATVWQPLWLVDLVRGVVDAREHPAQDAGGNGPRRFSATSDLNRAAEAVPYGMAIPPNLDRLDDLRNIPIDVWVDDDGFIRRLRHDNARPTTLMTSTLDLTELGIAVPEDWSRIPVFAGTDS